MVTVSGGDKAAKALAEIAAKLGDGGFLKVGFLEKAKYPDGTPVAMIAAIQNYGAPSRNIPPRPFFTNMVKEKAPTWPEGVKMALKAADYNVSTALNMIGDGIAGQLRESIINTKTPPLAESTIRKKGFSQPLIDTSHMLHSVDYAVVKT